MCSPFTIDIRPRRLPAEIKQIEETVTNHGIQCIVNNDKYDSLDATIPGPKETPYEDITFKISMEFDSHYPFRPPVVKFVTPVYHPNIDRDGKICLDVLQMPPGGSYNPAITLESILLSIQLLMACPNPDDPLRNDVSDEYKYNRELYDANAKKFSGDADPCDGISKTNGSPIAKDEVKEKTSDVELPTNETAKEVATTSRVNRKRKHEET